MAFNWKYDNSIFCWKSSFRSFWQRKVYKNIYYWSPFLVPIATPKAVVNSAKSLKNYGKNYECSIINFFGSFLISKS